MKVYGPYERKDGRRHVVIVDGSTTRTVSNARYVLASAGYKISPEDDVHHVDGDYTNDSIDNLRIVPKRQHLQEHNTIYHPTEFTCPVCGAVFTLSGKQVWKSMENGRRRGGVGPFCSRSCAGTYGFESRVRH